MLGWGVFLAPELNRRPVTHTCLHTMLVLFETPAGHALFKMLDDSVVRNAGDHDLESVDKIKGLVQLKAFSKFQDTTAALAAATALVESKPSKDLRKFLKREVKSGEEIAVGDAKLGAAIKDKTGLQCIYSQGVSDLMRGIRANLETLLAGEAAADAPARQWFSVSPIHCRATSLSSPRIRSIL